MKARPAIDAAFVAAVGLAGSGLTLAGQLGATGYGVVLGLAGAAGLVRSVWRGTFAI